MKNDLHDDADISPRGSTTTLLRLSDTHKKAKVEHRSGLNCGTDEQWQSSSHAVDHQRDVDDGSSKLDNTIDSNIQQGGRTLRNANHREDTTLG